MFYDDHNPPHFYAEYSGNNAVFDFQDNVLKGSLSSRTGPSLCASGLIYIYLNWKKTGNWPGKVRKSRKLNH